MFNRIAKPRVRRSKFNLSHERKISMNMADLIPSYVQEVVPGDKLRLNAEVFLRVQAMLRPIMHRINVSTHFFFVPNRLVWSEWEDFITGGEDGLDASVLPYMTINTANVGNFGVKKLPDYMGIPPVSLPITNEVNVSALPFRAYQMIYNEYYRDQNYIDKIDFSLSGGAQDATESAKLCALRKRAWEKDYFTSALPWAQRGASISIPGSPNYMSASEVKDTTGTLMNTAEPIWHSSAGILQGKNGTLPGRIENIEDMGIDINDLRRSVRLQEWLERSARGGSRYIEQILSHFGVKSSDRRLQRPEYLGGGIQPVVVSEVLQTANISEGGYTGDMAGHGLSVGGNHGFKRYFEEHGYVIGIISVIPKTSYQDGIHRTFQKFDKFDFYWPEFANLGEQEVKVGEIKYNKDATQGESDQTFGYQSRYAEYKYGVNSVHGDMRGNLSLLHLGRIFSTTPTLNQSFIECDPSTRIFAEDFYDKLWVQIYNKVDAIRPMPYFGTPTL